MKIKRSDVGLGNIKTEPVDILGVVCFVSALKTALCIALYATLLFVTLRFKVPPVVIGCAWGSLILMGIFGPSYFMRKLKYLGDGLGYNILYEVRKAYAMSFYMSTLLGVGSFVTFLTSILAHSDPDIQPLVWLFLGWVGLSIAPACFWIMRAKTLKKEIANAGNKI